MKEEPQPADYGDLAALRALAATGRGALCTIVGIDGSYSRRLSAQLAVLEDGTVIGSLADGCLEAQLAREAERLAGQGQPCLLRFGSGSPLIDFRLPCGSGLDIVVDPCPDIAAIREAVHLLDSRHPATLAIHAQGLSAPFQRHYQPALRLLILGTGPESHMLATQAMAHGIDTQWLRPRDRDGGTLSLHQAPDLQVDLWTAIILLFHDHEWERGLLPWALQSSAFYIGAQGGAQARRQRALMLDSIGVPVDWQRRLRSPVGLIPHAREPSVLGLSILAEIVRDFALIPPIGATPASSFLNQQADA